MTRLAIVAALLTASTALWSPVQAAETAEGIMQRMKAVYGALNTYADSGVVLYEYGAATSPSSSHHSFATRFMRAPRHFLFDFHKDGGDRFVVWADPDAFHTWWKGAGQKADYPNPNNLPAISLSEFPTSGVITKVPVLLYPKAPLTGVLSHFTNFTLEGTEPLAGHSCYKLAGRSSDLYGQTTREVNLRKVTVWIDADSSLVRQIREESAATGNSINRITTTYEPKANAALEAAAFAFAPPS